MIRTAERRYAYLFAEYTYAYCGYMSVLGVAKSRCMQMMLRKGMGGYRRRNSCARDGVPITVELVLYSRGRVLWCSDGGQICLGLELGDVCLAWNWLAMREGGRNERFRGRF